MLNAERVRVLELGNVNVFKLAPATTLFKGMAVGDNGSGLARPLAPGDAFLGFCERSVSNLSPSPGIPAVQGDAVQVQVLTRGLMELEVTGIQGNSVHAPVYASDEQSFTLSGYPNSPIGTVYRVLEKAGYAIVAFGYNAHIPLSSHTLLFAGIHKTTGGAVMEKISLPGLRASDITHAQLAAVGKTPCMIKTALPAANSLHVNFDADPSTDHVFHYVVYRVAA